MKIVKIAGIVLLVLVAVGFWGCATMSGLKENSQDKLMGYWRVEPNSDTDFIYLVFDKNNDCFVIDFYGEGKGKYTVQDNQIIVTINNVSAQLKFKQDMLVFKDKAIKMRKVNARRISDTQNAPQTQLVLTFLKSDTESYQKILSEKAKENLEKFQDIRKLIEDSEEIKDELSNHLNKLNFILEENQNKDNLIIRGIKLLGEVEVVREGNDWKINDVRIYDHSSSDDDDDCI